MSKKRTAETDLNHDNWDQEEEADEPGMFKTASEQQMRERKVIKAKRRTIGGGSTSEGLFASFKGFANTPTIQSSPGTFDFLKMLNKPPSDLSAKNTSTSLSSTSTTPPPDLIAGKTAVNPFANILGKNSLPQNSQNSLPEKNPPAKTEESSTSKPKRIKCDEEDEKKKKEDSSSLSKKIENKTSETVVDNSEAQKIFEEKVKDLNVRFVTFIHEKVKQNPNCILLPPLDDYRKYIERYVKEKLEAVNAQKLKQEGFNFNIPPRGATASVTIQNKQSGEVKTFPIGESKPSEKPATVGSGGIAKPANPLTGGFANKATFSASFSSKESNGPEAGSPTGGSEPSAKPSFSLSSSNKSDSKSSPSASFSFTNSSNSEAKTSPSIKPDGEPSKPNFSFSGGSLNKSDTPAKLPAFSWGSKASEKSDTPNSTKGAPSFFGLKPGTASGCAGFSWGAPKSNTDNVSEKSENPLMNPLTKSFSFGGSTTTSSAETGTTGGTTGTKPFTFGFANATPPPVSNKEEEADEEVLPKEEVKKVVEEDSVFNIKCKIFVMKPDKTYGERGVGNLFVKPVEANVKAQVIVRTETDTGKIIFNVVVSKNVPIKREKNNLILVTIPHPTTEKNPVPTTCLIKVKTAEDAEKLLNCLEEFKK